MVIGSCRIELAFPGNDSLKGKRRLVKSLIDRLRRKYNVAVAEVDQLDHWQRATLGVACVTNNRRFACQVLSRVVNWVEGAGEGNLYDYQIEIW